MSGSSDFSGFESRESIAPPPRAACSITVTEEAIIWHVFNPIVLSPLYTDSEEKLCDRSAVADRGLTTRRKEGARFMCLLEMMVCQAENKEQVQVFSVIVFSGFGSTRGNRI